MNIELATNNTFCIQRVEYYWHKSKMPGIIQLNGTLEDNVGLNDRINYVFHK